MTKQEEIIQAQKLRIAHLEVTLGMQAETEYRLYHYLSELHKLLTNDNPEIVQATIKDINNTLEKYKKHLLTRKNKTLTKI